jgi:hypothetical protein
MNYRLTTWYTYPTELRRFCASASVFLSQIAPGGVLAPRSRKLPVTEEHLFSLLELNGDYSAVATFQCRRNDRPLRGRISTPNPEYFPESICTFEIEFSAGPGFAKSPFTDAHDVAAALLGAACISGSALGEVEADDIPPELAEHDHCVFQEVDSMVVPVRIQWINCISMAQAKQLGWTDRGTPPVGEVECGDDYFVIKVTPEPFSFAVNSHVKARDSLEQWLGLEEAHARHPLNKS